MSAAAKRLQRQRSVVVGRFNRYAEQMSCDRSVDIETTCVSLSHDAETWCFGCVCEWTARHLGSATLRKPPDR